MKRPLRLLRLKCTMNSGKNKKSALRAEIKRRELEISDDYIRMSNEGIFKNVISMPEYQNSGNVFAYLSVGYEADTRKIIEHALENGKKVALPLIVSDGIMEARVISSLTELESGRFDIPAPTADSEILYPNELDMIIVPAAAFDLEGRRLGKGGGYYDRYLAGTKAFTVGLAREEMLLEEIPMEEHDINVKCVVTEKRIARLI